MTRKANNTQSSKIWFSKVWWTPIVVALIGVCTPFIQKCSSEEFAYATKVQARETGEDIQNANVTIEMIGKAPLNLVTDSKGYARAFLDQDWAGKPGRLTINANGYKKIVINIDLNPKTLPGIVQLEPATDDIPANPSGPFQYPIQVQASRNSENLANAKVTLYVGGMAPLDEITDSNGYARVFIDHDRAGEPGRLSIEANGYKTYVQNIDLDPKRLPDIVQLESEMSVTDTALPVTEAATSTNTSLTDGNDRWEITKNSQLRRSGRIVVDLPEGALVKILKNGEQQDIANVRGIYAFNLMPGQYDVKIHGAVVTSVPVQAAMDTHIFSGKLRIILDKELWRIYDESRITQIKIGNGPAEIGLPVGRYYVRINNDYAEVIINKNKVTEF